MKTPRYHTTAPVSLVSPLKEAETKSRTISWTTLTALFPPSLGRQTPASQTVRVKVKVKRVTRDLEQHERQDSNPTLSSEHNTISVASVALFLTTFVLDTDFSYGYLKHSNRRV
jgi:hypothetical protein